MSLPRPTFSGTVAVVALVVATSGTSYAAAALARNSVGNPQMKDNAIKSVEVANGSLGLADLAVGARAALQQPTAVPSGRTVKGVFGIDDHATAGGQDFSDFQSYGTPFASGLTGQIAFSPTVNCPGSDTDPRAAKGYVCLYPSGAVNAASESVLTGAFARNGFVFTVVSGAAGDVAESGAWAATAP